MLTGIAVPPRLEPLLRLGDDDSLRQKLDGWHNYVAEFGLTTADVPALVAVLQRWVDVVEEEEPDEDPEPQPEWCAPIHAWRALGQLRAVEAIEPMLAQNDRLDEAIDDWSMPCRRCWRTPPTGRIANSRGTWPCAEPSRSLNNFRTCAIRSFGRSPSNSRGMTLRRSSTPASRASWPTSAPWSRPRSSSAHSPRT